MRALIVAGALLLVSLPVSPVAAQEGPPDPERRERLEEQVRGRFVTQVAERLELTGNQREAVMGVLRRGAMARRDLAQESRELRRDLVRAVRADEASMDTYEALLDRLDVIRERERVIERREKEALEDVLDPRQQAMFLILRMQFNDRIRGMRGPRGPGGPGSMGSGSGGVLGPGPLGSG